MQGWDGWLHVNPMGFGARAGTPAEVGVAMIFNPTGAQLDITLPLPLYYTGLSTSALVSVDGAPAAALALGRDYSVKLRLSLAPLSIHTITVARP
jgi:hypothetical protein